MIMMIMCGSDVISLHFLFLYLYRLLFNQQKNHSDCIGVSLLQIEAVEQFTHLV